MIGIYRWPVIGHWLRTKKAKEGAEMAHELMARGHTASRVAQYAWHSGEQAARCNDTADIYLFLGMWGVAQNAAEEEEGRPDESQ